MPWQMYLGKAGELASRSEFLIHGYNVAVPDVDVGEDIFIVENASGRVWRVQVRTTFGKRKRYGFSARVFVSLKQLNATFRPPLVYVFAIRKDVGQWEFVIVPQTVLFAEYETHGIGSVHGDRLWLYFAFKETELWCGARNWQGYRNQLLLPVLD